MAKDTEHQNGGIAMARKNNIRSIRFSDELAELIDRQVGNTFTEKFENLVTRCVWELPQKERELERLNQEISERRQQLGRMSHTAKSLSRQLTDMLQFYLDTSYCPPKTYKGW